MCERFPLTRVVAVMRADFRTSPLAGAEDRSERNGYNSDFTIKQSKCYII